MIIAGDVGIGTDGAIILRTPATLSMHLPTNYFLMNSEIILRKMRDMRIMMVYSQRSSLDLIYQKAYRRMEGQRIFLTNM
jgi:hypothetical protein